MFQQLRPGVFSLDGAECRGGGKHGFDIVFGNDPPENACIGRADRFAFEKDGCTAFEQGGIDDVGVPHHPADVGCRPVDIACIHVINIFHAPFQGHHMPTVVPDNTFGFARCAGGIENIQRIGCCQGDTVMGGRCGHHIVPIEISAFDHGGGLHGALEDDALFRLAVGI